MKDLGRAKLMAIAFVLICTIVGAAAYPLYIKDILDGKADLGVRG